MDTFQHVEMDQATMVRRLHSPAIHWGAIAAGVVVGVSIYVFLNLLGVATSLSLDEVANTASARSSNGALWVLAWNGLSMLVAAFVGGYVAARTSGLKRGSDGVLHGFVSWSITTLIFAVLAASVSGGLFGSVFDGIYQSTQNGSTAGSSGGAMLGEKLEALVSGNNAAAPDIDPAIVQDLQQQIQAGRRGPALDLMVNSLGFEPERAAAVLDQALIVSQPPPASPIGRAAAAPAVTTDSGATWWLLGAVTLSLLSGVVGGSFGSADARRFPRPNIEE